MNLFIKRKQQITIASVSNMTELTTFIQLEIQHQQQFELYDTDVTQLQLIVDHLLLILSTMKLQNNRCCSIKRTADFVAGRN